MVRAGARPAWEIASCGAGAAGVTPRVDGVRVELRERAGAAFCASRRCAASAFYCWESRGGKPGGPDAPRARAFRCTEAYG